MRTNGLEMRRPSQGLRDESIAAKWEEVRQWEEGEAREQVCGRRGESGVLICDDWVIKSP